MSQYVDLNLDSRTRRFRFTPFDARNVCRLLNALPGYTTNGPVTANGVRVLLAGRDLDTWSAVLSEGLKHEDKAMSHDKAMRLVSDYLADGGDLVPVAQAIRKAGELSGVWEKPEEDGEPGGTIGWVFAGLVVLDVEAWITWAEDCAYGIMALTPWDFERIESTQTFRKLLDGAIRRHHLLEDLIGYLRLDILVAGGAKFPPPGAPPSQPDPQTPTFERLMGRPPVPLIGPLTAPPPETADEVSEEEAGDKALRARAMLYEALYKRQQTEDGAPVVPPPTAPDSVPPEPEP